MENKKNNYMKKIYQFIINSSTTFLLGCLLAFIILNLGIISPYYKQIMTDNMNILSSITEETFKYLICLLIIYKIKNQTYLIIPLISIGFGFTEEIIRLFTMNIFPLLPFFLHITTGIIMSILLYKASKQQSYIYFILALIIPTIIHIIYNILICYLITNL